MAGLAAVGGLVDCGECRFFLRFREPYHCHGECSQSGRAAHEYNGACELFESEDDE